MKPQEIFDAASVHLMGMEGPSLDQTVTLAYTVGKER